LEIGLAQSFIGGTTGQIAARSDYLLSGAAIQPMNVRIEAAIYAQNKSFFVIPGRWFNPDPTDTRENFERNGHRRPPGTHPWFPFFGEPLDIRIVIDGAVSENLPASLADVSEWMAKWGRTPPDYGGQGRPENAGDHRQHGLTFLYDPHLGWPVATDPSTGKEDYIRKDIYGRALPAAPSLPVSPSLIYYGEPL